MAKQLTSGTFPRLLADSAADSPHAEWVVLLHGLFATRRSMRKLEKQLSELGYHILNWDYPTLLRTCKEHVNRLLPVVEKLEQDPTVRAIHFVTHSMGGILVRYALHDRKISKVKRIVMLAPPNQGSHLTRLSLGPFRWLLPSIAELSEAEDSLPNRLVLDDEVEVGIIAAARDLIVKVSATHLDQQREHCTVATNHFQLPKQEQVVARVVNFLRQGSFEEPATANGPLSAGLPPMHAKPLSAA